MLRAENVPGDGLSDTASEGTAELYGAVPACWEAGSKGILLFGSQPSGLTADEQVGWMVHGGGQALQTGVPDAGEFIGP